MQGRRTYAPLSHRPAEPAKAAPPVMAAPVASPAAPVRDLGPGIPMHIRAIAARGAAAADEPLPHLDRVQRAFGAHDVSHVRASVGGAGGAAANDIGARAYAMGDAVAFREQPDVRLVAHEAAHVVQQRAGLKLVDGVSKPDDEHERAADAVADAVIEGKSAEPLLDRAAPRLPSGPAPRAEDAPVQRQLWWAHTQHPYSTFPKSPDPGCDPIALHALDTEVVNLQGTSTFNPSKDLARALACFAPGPVTVHVELGKLAHGDLRILPRPSAQMSIGMPGAPPPFDYDTEGVDQLIELTHPLLPGYGWRFPPRARIWIKNSIVHGVVAFDPGKDIREGMGLATWAEQYNQSLGQLFGWGDALAILGGTLVNSIENGVLSYGFSPFTFELPADTNFDGSVAGKGQRGMRGTGSYTITDDSDVFTAKANIEGAGIASGTMPVHKHAARFTGAGSYAVTLAPVDAFGGKFSGSIDGAFGNGQLTLTGRVKYAGGRANGDVTLMLAPRAVAWQHVKARASALAPGAGPSATSPTDAYAIVGWGTVTFPVNDWLEGKVSAVVDPDGFISAVASLRTTKDFTFLDDEEKYGAETTLFETSGTVPIVDFAFASITGGYDAKVTAKGRIGPLTIHDVVVTGTFSTRKGTVFSGSATGRVRLEAEGSITGKLSGSVAVTFLHVVDAAKIQLNGEVEAKAQAEVEIAPTFELLPTAAGGDASQANFKISGDLSAKAAASLGLKGSLTFHRMIFFIPDVSLGSYEWTLGELDLTKHFSYEIGTKAAIDADVKAGDISPSAFKTLMSALSSKNKTGASKSSGDHDHQSIAQDEATAVDDPEDNPDPTDTSAGFVMNGQAHTLSVTHEPNAVIHMASADPGDLDDKLAAEVETTEEEEDSFEPGDPELTGKLKAANNLLAESHATEHALDAEKSDVQKVTEPNLKELATGVGTFGDKYGEPDLGTAVTPPDDPFDHVDPDDPPGTVVILKGRYVIENEPQLKATQQHFDNLVANPPTDATEEDLAPYWARWKDEYFPARIAEFHKALGADPLAKPSKTIKKKKGPAKTVKIKGPQTWDAYADGQATFDEIRAAKDFQPELRTLILAEHEAKGTPIDETKAEIDVGLRATRPGVKKSTNFADLVLPGKPSKDPSDPPTLEVYSLKVRNVQRQLDKDPKDLVKVRTWIADAMKADVHEAAQKYGFEVEYRRKNVSTPEGTASPGGAKNPNFKTKFRVNLVHLVWKNDPTLIPPTLKPFILETGQVQGMAERKSSKTKVDFTLEPK